MIMRVAVYIFLFLSPFCLKAQSEKIETDEQLLNASNTMLLSYKEDSFLISGDSIYRLTSSPVTAKPHQLELFKYNYVHQGNQAFLVNASNGIVYAFDGQTFERLDQSFEFKSQYDHFPFIREGTLHTFGGYGLFTYKNIITRFDPLQKETLLVHTKGIASLQPPRMSRVTGQFSDNNLYVTAGETEAPEVSRGDVQRKTEEVWRFNFLDNEWVFLGSLEAGLSKVYALENDFSDQSVYFDNTDILILNFKDNQLIRYTTPNVSARAVKDLTYNAVKDGFYFVKQTSKFKKELQFMDRTTFLGSEKEFQKLYHTTTPWTLYAGLLGVLVIIVGLALRKKKTAESRIRNKQKKIYALLSSKEIEILEMLLHKNPDHVTFPSLMQLFNQDLSYDNLKKKLRGTLDSLDEKLMRFFKQKNSFLEERKSIDDARVKEIRLRQK